MKNVLTVLLFLVMSITLHIDAFACISKISETSMGIENLQKDGFRLDSLPESKVIELKKDLNKAVKQKKQTAFVLVLLVLFVVLVALKKMFDDFHLHI